MTIVEKLITKKLQDKFNGFIEKISFSLSKPEKKFLKAVCFGILSSRSCIVRRTAQSLKENISSKKTQERLIYHLDKEELNKKMSQVLLQRQCRKLKKESLIIIDPSDIVKRYATKMEGLSRVRDGNDGKWKNGYDALDIIGINRENEKAVIFPLCSQLHSNAMDIDTMKNKLFDRLSDIIVYSHKRGIFVFDRGFDDRKVIGELHSHAASYIIRLKKNREVWFRGKKINIKSVGKETKLGYRFYPQPGIRLSAGISSVNIPLSPHPVKNPVQVEAKLIVVKMRSKKKDGTYRSGMFYLLCNLPESSFSNRQIVKFVLDSYRLRWKIEEVHRQVKTDFGWENIRLHTYRRLQFMNTLLWIALSFLYELESWKFKMAKVFTNLMLEKKNPLSKLSKFVYYKPALVIEYCFDKITPYNRTTFQNKQNEPLQIRIPFL